MKIEEVPDEVLNACRARGMSDVWIAKASPQALFREYCEWNGLIGWSSQLWSVVIRLMNDGRSEFEGNVP